MDKRLVGRCAALGVGAALAFSATAQGATRDVQAGPFVRADAPRFERALGDANAYFVKRVTIREGDRVRCTLEARPNADLDDGEGLRRRFLDLVTDENLRATVGAETEGVRNVILALAFGALARSEQADTASP